MPTEQAQATFYVDKAKWLKFQSLCRLVGKFASQELRDYVDSYIEAREFDEQIQKEREKNERT